jgi:hypothetical protein
MTGQELLDHLSDAGHRIGRGASRSMEMLVDGFQVIPQTGWEAIAAIGTAAAALFAAWSAWTSRHSARAAREAVDEARAARKDEKAPRLVLERDFLDFRFVGRRTSVIESEPRFLARTAGGMPPADRRRPKRPTCRSETRGAGR